MTIGHFTDLDQYSKMISEIRVTIETAFFRNNVKKIYSLEEAYYLALNSPGTIELTGMPIFKPEEQGLPKNAKMLLFNDGQVFGRCAAARVVVGEPGVNLKEYSKKIREAVYQTRNKKMYHAEAIIGLENDFMVKAHLIIPENHENILFNWLLNFQWLDDYYQNLYKQSRPLPDKDIYIFSDPDWSHPDHPMGLTFFDSEQNCAALLGMRYFGEHKKGTLTLAWGIAARNGYASCHGGLKRYNLSDGRKYTVAVFGLSGSGKSTITHSKHENKYDITILHDDAMIINVKDKYSIALEPTYFDKTADYPIGCEDNKYILTLQNNGAYQDSSGLIYPATGDFRNGNGRAIKSKFWSPNRVDRIDEPIDAIFWLMKDPSIPPVLKLHGASSGATMGATLATKRTSAERLAPGVDPDALVVEPYANPFRTYPLGLDFERFKKLLEKGVDCYILNTGDFRGKKVQPHHTLQIIESIVEGKQEFTKWGNYPDVETMVLDGFDISLKNATYKKQFIDRMKDRIKFVLEMEEYKEGINQLPSEALIALEEFIIHA